MGLGNNRRPLGVSLMAGLCLTLVSAQSALAETTVDATGASTTTVAPPAPAPSGAKIIAGIDLRPTMDPAAGVFRTEDSVELGYRFNPKLAVTYLQGFGTNLYTPDSTLGVKPALDRGFLRTRISKILNDESNGLSFGYQNRIYLPTAGYDTDVGNVSMVRNYFTLTKKFGSSVTVALTEMPIFHFNTRAGNGDGANASAVAAFQNRVYLEANIQITEKLSLLMPVMFHQTKYANYQAGARRNDSWDYFVWIYPEVTYQFTDVYSMGVAYYSANLMKPDLSDFDLENGLSNGSLQVAFTAYL